MSIRIPEHTLIRKIGGGGGGEVWLARNTFGFYRAVKVVQFSEQRRHKASRAEYEGLARYEPVSRLHDGLVDVLQLGSNEAEGYFYYVMELADGVGTGQNIDPETYIPRTLAQDLRDRGRLPITECVLFGSVIASALGFLHRQQLIHRDLKPSNIVFINGFPKLADIGLLTGMSDDGEYLGTEGFIPPEGCGTAQADLFSLGRVLYEMSTGNPASQFPTLPYDLGKARDSHEVAQFNRIVLKACEPAKRWRYQSSDELMIALLSFQFTPKRSVWRSHGDPIVWIVGLAGAIIGTGFIIFLVWRLVYLLRQMP